MRDNFCINCDQKVPIWIRHRKVTIERKSVKFTCDEAYAICQYCGEEVYDPQVNDRNAEAYENAYNMAKGANNEN